MTSARRSPAVQDYWQEFCRSRSIPADQRYDVFAFGDTPALADELLALLLAGPKRATAALVAQFERSGDPLPEAGLHSVVLNGRGEPGCVIRTTEVEVKPFDQVDARFAWDEGEDDRTLTSWIKGHRRYFMRQCASWGIPFDESMPVVFERFELVWPKGPELVHGEKHRADRHSPRSRPSLRLRPVERAAPAQSGPLDEFPKRRRDLVAHALRR